MEAWEGWEGWITKNKNPPRQTWGIFLYNVVYSCDMTIAKMKLMSKKYPNLWVALDGKSGNVAGAGKTPKVAFAQSQKKGVKDPVLTKIPKEYGFYVLSTI